MLFHKMRTAIAAQLNTLYSHPFNVDLYKGTLPRDIFHTFLEQDRLYLYDFSKALTQTAGRLSNEKHKMLFHKFAKEMVQSEINILHKYLPKPFSPSLFQPAKNSVQKISAISQYTAYLFETTNHASIEEAVACLIPCFYIYSTLGIRMRPMIHENNPYKLWIYSYSNERFLLSTQLIIQTLEELSRDSGIIDQKPIITAFVTSTQFEIAFWDSIYASIMENQDKPALGICGFM